jgi:hypothetical protein
MSLKNILLKKRDATLFRRVVFVAIAFGILGGEVAHVRFYPLSSFSILVSPLCLIIGLAFFFYLSINKIRNKGISRREVLISTFILLSCAALLLSGDLSHLALYSKFHSVEHELTTLVEHVSRMPDDQLDAPIWIPFELSRFVKAMFPRRLEDGVTVVTVLFPPHYIVYTSERTRASLEYLDTKHRYRWPINEHWVASALR